MYNKKSNKIKKTGILMFLLVGVSFITSFQLVASASHALKTTLGHNFEEEAWSVSYDFAGDHLQNDYNPGALSDEVTVGATDSNTNVDSTFFGSYTNIDNVHTLYLAMENYSWGLDTGNTSLYGCSPFQTMIQHFQPAGAQKIHVAVMNSFYGLLAYQDNVTDGLPDVPDENDSLYIGWSYYNEWHKFVANILFLAEGMPLWMMFDESTRCEATPIPLTTTTVEGSKSYRFGMSYKNVFVLWQKIDIDEALGDSRSLKGAEVLEACSAFSMIDTLNFTFVINSTEVDSGSYKEITTTTEYDIGAVTDLWVVNDNESVTNWFGGDYFELTPPDVDPIDFAYYNETEVVDRLDGNATVPGYGLSVLNTANIIVMDTSKVLSRVYDGPDDFVDQTGEALGDVSKNIQGAQYNFSGQPAYEIDFASKPKYTLNGATEYDAPTQVLKDEAVKINVGGLTRFFMDILISGFIGNVTGDWLAGLHTLLHAEDIDFFYMTCFPTWSGGVINQDPTFSVFVPVPSGGWLIWLIGIVGVSVVVLVIVQKKRAS